MSTLENFSRRSFLQGLASGSALILGARLAPGGVTAWAAEATGTASFEPNVWLAIDTDGSVRIVTHRSEMGTGIRTALPTVVAEELEADWSRVSIVQAPGDEKYGSQNTDGSRSVRRFYQGMREAGAAARAMLEQAAANRWDVPVNEVKAKEHRVLHAASGRSLGFGELVGDAAKLPVPPTESLTFKSRSEWRLVGKDVPLTDMDDLLTGQASFGADIRLPGMRFAVVARPPVVGGKVSSFDAKATLKLPGVVKVVELPQPKPPLGFQPLGGIAVVATSTWAAKQGRDALKIEWDHGTNASLDSTTEAEALSAAVNTPGTVVREKGDVDAVFTKSERIHEAEYHVPQLVHAPMEPPCAVADVSEDGCKVWAPTQNPQAARDQAATSLGLDKSKVHVEVTLLGGGFGRKSKPDMVAEAALLSREVKAPVLVQWTREDDIRHGYYHSPARVHVKAALGNEGMPEAWQQRSAFPSIGWIFNPATEGPLGFELGLGFTDLPHAVPNLKCESGKAATKVRIGWLRSVSNIQHAFALSSFADELAAEADRDPLEYLHALIGEKRALDPNKDGAQYSNYGEELSRYPIDTGRLRATLQAAADGIGWGRKLKKGRGLGIAVHRSFLSYVATAIEVKVSRKGELSIPRVDIALDAGTIIHPDRARAQMEGSVIFGLSLAMLGEITMKEGRVQQSNFHDYQVLRMNQSPSETKVHLIEGEALPAGIGEPGVPPIAPALTNAIFAATGKRVRELPLSKQDLSWS